MKIKKQDEWYSVRQCQHNPNTLYIFGDNVMRAGKGGQAIIRDCQNSFGIVTKWAPGKLPRDYFSDFDTSLNHIKYDLIQLKDYLKDTIIDTVVFPADGLGTGLSDLPNKAPDTYKEMNDLIFKQFGIKYD